MSTNTFGGSPDLDTRTCGMAREDTLTCIQECPECHFCSPDVTAVLGTASTTINSEQYSRIAQDKSLPEFCRKWACWGQLQETAGQLPNAGWACLSAAWACDDSGKKDLAIQYRKEAMRLFRKAQQINTTFGNDAVTEATILTDLLRRTDQFPDATATAESALELLTTASKDSQKLIRSIIEFELHLISSSDSDGHTIAEAMKFAKKSQNPQARKWWQFWRSR